MRYFKYIFFFLIFNFSIIGDHLSTQFNPLNYIRLTESVLKKVFLQDLNRTYFWSHVSINQNNFQFFVFKFKNFQVYVDHLFKLRFLNQNRLFDKIDIFNKEIFKYKEPRLSTEIFFDLC
jgi:hypothetical protein